MGSKVEKAAEVFSHGFNCAQAVFSAYAPDLGITEEDALRITSGFGDGMARLQEVCGAVTGAFMAIGARYGSADANDEEAKKKTHGTVREFEERFRALHGTILCRELLGVDLNTEEGQEALHSKGLLNSVCAVCVRDAAEIAEELISKGSR